MEIRPLASDWNNILLEESMIHEMGLCSICGKENWEGHKSSAVENQLKEPLPHQGSQPTVTNNRKEQRISKKKSLNVVVEPSKELFLFCLLLG